MSLIAALGLKVPKGLEVEAPAEKATASDRALAGAAQPQQRGGSGGGTISAAGDLAMASGKGGKSAKVATDPVMPPPPTVKGKEVTDYAEERKAVKALVDALNAHAQAARISSELGKIATKMASAGAHAVKAEWPGAMADLAEARAACVAAKTLADNWQTYSTKRAIAAAQGTALKGMDDAMAAAVEAELKKGDVKMKASPQNFVGAMAHLTAIDDTLRPDFKAKVDVIKGRLAGVEALDAELKKFLNEELVNGRAIVADLDAAFAANEWSKVIMLWRAGWNELGGAQRYAERRTRYQTQLAITKVDIAAVKALPAVADRGRALDAQLAQADLLASRDTMKMEEGLKVLLDASQRCDALKKIAPTVTSHDSERKAADAEFAALSTGAAAAQLVEPLNAVRGLLTQAAGQAARARANAGDPTAQWQAALTAVQRARADLATAKTLAAGLGPAAAATKAADGGAPAMKKALEALKADAAVAAKAANADQAKEQFDRCTVQAEAAGKALDKGDAKVGADALRLAATALAAARGIQAGHAQFLTTLAATEAQLAELRALKNAKLIAARIDPVANAIASAKQHASRHDSGAAIAALRVATDGVAAAKQADKERTEYDALAKKATDRAPEVTDAKLRKVLDKAIADAGKQADALTFGEATKALKKVLVQIDEVKLKAGMKKTPPDPNLRQIVKDMVGNGGAASVDAAIQESPDSPASVITDLASARYGKEFSFEGSAPGQHEVKSMKRCCEVFAKIADDIVDNPSIKDISHVDAIGSAGGGYTGSTAHIGMEGRVGIQQKFGKNEVNYDPKTGTNVKALPDDIDPKCLPANNDDVEYLGFAAAHEVGHGVDDLRGFMKKNGSQEKYGGWKSYGGDVQPIADAVGAEIAGKHGTSTFYKTPESKKYVLDKLMSRPALRPPSATPGGIGYKQADFDAFDAFDAWHALATADNVYRRQGDCDKIKIKGLIYHEAYVRSWVSYSATARSKGLTGYQFRAPGEWFAELYAGWKSGQLQKDHPAVEWLKKL